ncbi:hypothetical protein GCM10023165_53420 [Variovorax defluvii]|uniref:HTH luxR-type domain-containing protein n=1 Tax=Variovorax defluvii TaxID=913761 RepID=A0ABP8IGZ5_9BURK
MHEMTRKDAAALDTVDEPCGTAAPPRSAALALLSPKDVALMRWLAAGLTNLQIASASYRSEKTVANQLTCLYAKLGARNRAEAVAIYLRMGGD